MVQSNAEGVFDRLKKKLKTLRGRLYYVSEEEAQHTLDEFMSELRERQPDGSKNLDPLANYVTASGYKFNREPRPSIRQGIVPISEGWQATIERTLLGHRIRISSSSDHLKYFTLWTGRDYLGTDEHRIAARNKRTLAFWWKGHPNWPQSVWHKGFTPKTDFVDDAFLATKEDASSRMKRAMRRAVVDILG